MAIASRFDVSGYVRNEPDGSVTVVAEGEEGALREFLGAVRGSPIGRYISTEDLNWGTATGEYLTFDVRFGP